MKIVVSDEEIGTFTWEMPTDLGEALESLGEESLDSEKLYLRVFQMPLRAFLHVVMMTIRHSSGKWQMEDLAEHLMEIVTEIRDRMTD